MRRIGLGVAPVRAPTAWRAPIRKSLLITAQAEVGHAAMPYVSTLHGARCTLHGARCTLHGARSALHVVCVVCWMLRAYSAAL
jgi:hypothetical protein